MSDRTIVKQTEQGELAAAGLANPRKIVGEKNEETFVFDLDADAAQAERGIACRKAFIVKAVELMPSSDLAAHATAYTTFTVGKRDGAGGAAVNVAAVDTATGGSNVSLQAFRKTNVPLSATLANRKFAVGNVLTFKSAETGAPTSPLGTCAVTVEYI